jgi:prepilin-type N-terminal cleavage/methylation domain-containing protein
MLPLTRQRRLGFTLAEIVMVLALLGIIAGFAFPRFAEVRDRLAVRGATSSVVFALATARHSAIRRATRVAVTIDTATAQVYVRAGPDTLEHLDLRDVHGVTLEASRDSVAYTPMGLGYGAANTRLVLRRGSAVDTVTVSRLGRVRRS